MQFNHHDWDHCTLALIPTLQRQQQKQQQHIGNNITHSAPALTIAVGHILNTTAASGGYCSTK